MLPLFEILSIYASIYGQLSPNHKNIIDATQGFTWLIDGEGIFENVVCDKNVTFEQVVAD